MRHLSRMPSDMFGSQDSAASERGSNGLVITL
jgi:hypothetical protein